MIKWNNCEVMEFKSMELEHASCKNRRYEARKKLYQSLIIVHKYITKWIEENLISYLSWTTWTFNQFKFESKLYSSENGNPDKWKQAESTIPIYQSLQMNYRLYLFHNECFVISISKWIKKNLISYLNRNTNQF